MGDLVFSDINKTYRNGIEAVKGFSLRIPSPTLAVIVGPSGCGKTTVLRLLAGLEDPTGGEIYLGQKRIDALEPRNRDIAMVFQSYALFPHMTVRENLSFGLSIRKIPKDKIRSRVEFAAGRLEIKELLERKPGELSGGQRQRVALGRAIVREPRVFLFDEPLSSLDAKLRMDMRYMIKKLYNDMGTTTIYVTHDQVEAMTIGEMLIVMEGGRIHQVGSPEECYHHPEDTFVASFLGSPPMNLLDATFDPADGFLLLSGSEKVQVPAELAERLRMQDEISIIIGIRPEDLRPAGEGAAADCFQMNGKVVLTEPLGYEKLIHIGIGEVEVVAKSQIDFPADHDGQVSVIAEPSRVLCFSRKSGRNMQY